MTDVAHQAMVDVSTYPVELTDGRFAGVPDALVARLVELVADGAGLAVCHGASALLDRHGLDIHREADAAAVRDYFEAVFRAFAAAVDPAPHSPLPMGYDQVASMDVDGFNKNTSFTPNSDHTESREFLTTKCVHFDSATTFIGNVYGPNTNIDGGLPIVCDTRAYCRENGVDPADLIELMPHSYNVAVKQEHTEAVLARHAVALDVDLKGDMVMVVLNNEVDGGLAHAGSTPRLADPARPGKRPLRHIELQFTDGENLNNWYRHYRLDIPEVKVKVPDLDTPDHNRYHRGVDTALAAQSPATPGKRHAMSLLHRPDAPAMSPADEAELADLLDLLNADDWPEDLFEGRTFYDQWGTPVAADVRVTEREAGGVPAYVLTPPDADPARIGIWLHGGGYVFGTQTSHGSMVAEAARSAGCAFLHPQYRRAPEHKFPAPVEDAVAVYAALLDEGRAPESIVMAGDSAGGGLLLAALLAARDRGLPMPAAAAVVSPWTDLAGTGETFTTKEDIDPLMSRSVVDDVAEAYLDGTAPETPYASPHYGDPHGFPPVLIQVGEREMLHSDSERFAAKLAAAGSPVSIEVWPGMVHVWHMHHSRLAKAREALARLGAFLREPGTAAPREGARNEGNS